MDSFSEKSLMVALSREELAYLVLLAGADRLPGLDAPAAAILRLEQKDGVYAAVERSLLARRMLYVQEDRHLAAAPVLLDLIRLCIKPAYAVLIAVADADEKYTGWRIFYVLPNVTVVHRPQVAGIHKLTAVAETSFDLVELAATLLAMDGAGVNRIVLLVSSLLQVPPITHEYTIWSADGEYWFGEKETEDGVGSPQKRQVTREELSAILEAIGEPIRALSTLQIEPQP